MFQHQFINGAEFDYPLGKIVAIGRNYAEHAKELNNPIPTEPILFIKPATAAVDMQKPFSIPQGKGAVHHELEIALLIGKTAKNITEQNAWDYVAGIGLGLDLTLRDVQDKLKEKGHPWEKAKAFDGANPLSHWLLPSAINDKENISLQLTKNGEVKQSGNSNMMITSIPELLAYASSFFTLQPGDVVMTGTPAGVGPLHSGDELVSDLNGLLIVSTNVR